MVLKKANENVDPLHKKNLSCFNFYAKVKKATEQEHRGKISERVERALKSELELQRQ
mgnify:CR=1 FL=1